MSQEELFRTLNTQYAANLPFTIYRKPGASTLNVLFQENDAVLTTTDFTESGFVFSPFDKKAPGILILGIPQEIEECRFEADPKHTEIKLSSNSSAREKHIALVSKAIVAIEESGLQKVVLSRKQNIKDVTLSPIELFEKLCGKYPNAFVYLWSHPKVGTWLGATPETLLSLNGRRFETMALAGTQPYNGSLEVAWGNKEQEEQQLVTNEIVVKLKPFDLRSLEIQERETYRAGTLLHLRTRITGTFNTEGQNLKALLEALHPTPAVCGLPRDAAKDFIIENEEYDREFYTGFLGEINVLKDTSKKRNRRNVENLAYKTFKNTTQLYVNLRCMQYVDHQATVYVGGGITQGSNPEKEWEETVNKAETIASIL